jgi:hypothetical protein
MSNYTKLVAYDTKDGLTTGDPLKRIKGTELDDEFDAISTAIATKANSASPEFTGAPTTPTVSSAGNSSTQIASTAFVQAAIALSSNKTTNWTWYETAGVLYFETGGVKKMKIDSSGNITVTGNVTAFGSV